jgi:uncharacterized membrane protein YkoI
MPAVCPARVERGLKPLFIGRSASARDNQAVLKSRHRFHLWPALLLALSAAAASPLAQADNEQDQARAAVQAGKVLPLKTVLERLAREVPGQVLEVDLEQEDGRWIYEIKLLQPGGRLVKLELDAATAAILKRRERPAKPDHRR